MRPLQDTVLLDTWEQGRKRGPATRRLLMLATALPALGADRPAELSVGEADAALLRLRQATFGPQLPAEITCRHCGETLEFELDADALLGGWEAPAAREFALEDGTRFRLPGYDDLAAIAGLRDVGDAVRRLAALCRLDAPPEASIDDETIAAADARLAELDRQAVIRLRLDCVNCSQSWGEDFDIGGYFWTEIEQRAALLLDEVHILAATYGWPEASILALPGARRAAYLERCSG